VSVTAEDAALDPCADYRDRAVWIEEDALNEVVRVGVVALIVDVERWSAVAAKSGGRIVWRATESSWVCECALWAPAPDGGY
jgi:hypothetical protein